MKMKRYFAADARQALRELREDQGPDAVILSNRRVDGGVEIIAALDYEDALDNNALGRPHHAAAEPEAAAARQEAPAATGRDDFEFTLADKSAVEDSGSLASIRSELKGLRSIIEAPFMQLAWGEMSRVQPLHANLLKQLMTLGLDSRLSEALVNKVAGQGLGKTSWVDALKLLAAIIPVQRGELLDDGGVVSLVGPTGVGKTTTIAKLAARFALRHGRRNVSLITTDSYRIAAHEQLRTYGRILGVPVQVATDARELRNALEHIPLDSAGPHLTLIDTAGIGQADMRLAEQLATLAVDDIEIRNYLVLSATGQRNLQDSVVRAFGKAGLHGCILTKTDEASSLGEALSVMIQHNLALAYVCNGQKVPDDMHKARGKVVVKQAVQLMKQAKQGVSDEELAFSFGAIAGGMHV